jgi:hypothetical protein
MFQRISLIFIALTLLCLTSCNQDKTIQFRAALVYGNGVQPVARTKFYLLKEDSKAITAKENAKGKKGNIFYSPFTERLFKATGDWKEGYTRGIQEDVIKDYVVATTTTDFEGNGKFENIPSGVYYIGGYTETRSADGVFWCYKVDTQTNKDIILLDQKNALEVEQQ